MFIIIFKILSKIRFLLLYNLSLIFSYLLKIKPHRVIIWSVLGKEYSCNPKYISKSLSAEGTFDVYWIFQNKYRPIDFSEKYLILGTIKYIWYLNTAEYLITNHRTQPHLIYWRKKKNQKYIMTWHGSMPLKKIEKDALNILSNNYEKIAKRDSVLCDLMISDSAWFTNLIRSSFWYKGEILECGMPRNDIFFDVQLRESILNKIHKLYGIPLEAKLVLYAPTFRQNKDTSIYVHDWDTIIKTISKHYKCDIYILVRLHPWLKGNVTYENIKHNCLIDVTNYNDIQDLLVASDILITDFSSTMFDFAIQNKPCFLISKDLNNYERGTYFSLNELPFIKALNEHELCIAIDNINLIEYVDNQTLFIKQTFNPIITNNSTGKIIQWMKLKSIKYSKALIIN